MAKRHADAPDAPRPASARALTFLACCLRAGRRAGRGQSLDEPARRGAGCAGRAAAPCRGGLKRADKKLHILIIGAPVGGARGVRRKSYPATLENLLEKRAHRRGRRHRQPSGVRGDRRNALSACAPKWRCAPGPADLAGRRQ